MLLLEGQIGTSGGSEDRSWPGNGRGAWRRDVRHSDTPVGHHRLLAPYGDPAHPRLLSNGAGGLNRPFGKQGGSRRVLKYDFGSHARSYVAAQRKATTPVVLLLISVFDRVSQSASYCCFRLVTVIDGRSFQRWVGFGGGASFAAGAWPHAHAWRLLLRAPQKCNCSCFADIEVISAKTESALDRATTS